MAGLSTKYIENLIKTIMLDSRNFIGVLSCDMFLRMTKIKKINLSPGKGIILNLSSSNHPGSHWVAIYLNSDDIVEFFDSFGLHCFDSNILEAFDDQKLRVIDFKKRLQHEESQFCGYYCVAWLLCREVNISSDIFGSFFNEKNLMQNDHICTEIIKTFIEMRAEELIKEYNGKR